MGSGLGGMLGCSAPLPGLPLRIGLATNQGQALATETRLAIMQRTIMEGILA